MTTTSKTLAEKVNALPWYHRIELPGGVVTPGVVETSRVLPRFHLPESLSGRTVLDVGAWDGAYSFECARRGAARVLATDLYAWYLPGWGSKDAFLLARDALGLTEIVDDQEIEPWDLAPDRIGGQFDVVLFLGVLYHLKDPITAIERVTSCCKDLLVLETETALNLLPYPAARIHPGSELANDPTNWYQFNIRALRRLLGEVGFGSFEVKYRHPLHRRVARAAIEARRGRSFRATMRSDRVVVHARRSSRPTA